MGSPSSAFLEEASPSVSPSPPWTSAVKECSRVSMEVLSSNDPRLTSVLSGALSHTALLPYVQKLTERWIPEIRARCPRQGCSTRSSL